MFNSKLKKNKDSSSFFLVCMFPRVCMCVKDSSSKNLQFSGGCGSWNENDENDDDDDDGLHRWGTGFWNWKS